MKSRCLGLWFVLVAVLAATQAYAQNYDRRVRIENFSSVTMTYFYASNVDRPTWEEDILGDSVLPAGHSVVINIDDGSGYCRYDFRAIFADGSEAIRAGVNVCEVGVYSYYD
ncbi:hypothetical protein [Pelagibacterium xiamenense]|uniref:hypothetical protein n=1 Tax=Pelagibacterium xiamenense TaxID=2901140 RepID=UPI001E51E274|nr:hypothetical protein [Pelagibacterium xiamenense]MCD7059350.1 hypothetical protein [Pelagibacterium xiamenense]